MSSPPTEKPKTLRTNLGGIPDELKAIPHWLNWSLDFRNGAWTKTPRNPHTGGFAAVDEPATWSTFDKASERSDKIGFVLTEHDDVFFIDIDQGRDPATGDVVGWAALILDAFRAVTYIEISPSRTGFKIIGRGTLPAKQHVKRMGDGGKVECFDAGKYTTITGRRALSSLTTIGECQALLDALYAGLFPEDQQKQRSTPPKQGKTRLTDGEILEIASAAENGAKFRRLFYDGSLVDYGDDESSADLGLLCIIAFYTKDISQLERLFSRSALAQRDKWMDREDYRERSLAKALELTVEHYTPHSEPLVGGVSADEAIKRNRESNGHGGDVPPPSDAEPDTKPNDKKVYALTDYGNGERLVHRHGGDIRFCHLWGKWFAWDANRFLVDDDGSAHRLGKQTVRTIYAEAELGGDKKERAAIASHAMRSEAAPRIDAMLKMAASESGIPVSPDDLDRDPWLLNVQNGTIDLRTGKLRPHRRNDLITKLAMVPYESATECPTFLAFLDQIMAGHKELIEFLRRAIGYSLTGDTSERVIFILHGEGRNGKSTLLEVLRSMLGDYALRTPTETLLARRDTGIPNDVARLKGTRFVSASEAEEGQRLAEAKIKDLTGGDTISARFMRAEFFDFSPTFKLWLGTNHKPVIRGTDHAIWDRIRLVPFTVRISPEDQDRHLRDKLLAEAPGILAWAVQGCLDWQKSGLSEPEEVRGATAAYRAEMDVLGGFIGDRCRVGKNESATAKDLYSSYLKWCEENGEKPISNQTMGRKLHERGFDSKKIGNQKTSTWFGVGLFTQEQSRTDGLFDDGDDE